MVSRKRVKILETPSGVGEVFEKDTQIAQVEYNLEVQQEIIIAKSHDGTEELDGMKSVNGFICVLSGEKYLIGKNILTLKMQDGRKIDFFVRHFSPTDKNIMIQPTGKFY